jgi:FPC/CPF motif-containing protein YcgG
MTKAMPASPPLDVPSSLRARIITDVVAFVGDARYPCLGARSSLRAGGLRVRIYGPMSAERTTSALSKDLALFAVESGASRGFAAMMAVFVESAPETELAFEGRLWDQLDAVSATDETTWAESVSADRDDPRYAFSFAGRPFFVVGMHPESSRHARRLAWPALVFNPHEQFRQLRASNRFERLRAAIRRRDIALQGTINPNLADAGEASEARQYSGRDSGAATACPFHRRVAKP